MTKLQMKDEKSLPLYHSVNGAERPRKSKWWAIPFVIGVCLTGYLGLRTETEPTPSCMHDMWNRWNGKNIFEASDSRNPDNLCPLLDKVDPSKYLYNKDFASYILKDEEFRNDALKKLIGAINIPTQVYDDMKNPNVRDTREELYKEEPRWKPFEAFHEYLAESFPLVYEKLEVEEVNKFGLVYTWKGTEDLKPVLFTAHMDVVPVDKETLKEWKYPPFNATYDEGLLFGRGAIDCKNLLIGLLQTLELLLKEGQFTPRRTIVVAFGYDEESAGTGAEAISKHLIAKHGKDSFYAVIDEGNDAFATIEGTNFILPATGEKGHLNSIIDLHSKGGHSSVPPPHTLIGIIAKLIEEIEETPFQSIITNANPVLNQLQCLAEHSKGLNHELRKNILRAHFDQDANKKILDYLSQDEETKFLVTTSQAADIVEGGVKSNALPEFVSLLVNHRIAIEESVDLTKQKILENIISVAKKYNYGVFTGEEEILPATEKGYFNYTLQEELMPAPVSPINDFVWKIYGGSLRYLYEDIMYPNDTSTFVVAPYISTGNTDTRFYWDLSRNIYRYLPMIPDAGNMHSVNEYFAFDGHLYLIAFYYYYIQVIDSLGDML